MPNESFQGILSFFGVESGYNIFCVKYSQPCFFPSQVPTPLRDSRRRFLAMKWMITECREHKQRRTLMPERLSHQLLEAFNNQGPVIKKKYEMHKVAEANRAFAHFRWWQSIYRCARHTTENLLQVGKRTFFNMLFLTHHQRERVMANFLVFFSKRLT